MSIPANKTQLIQAITTNYQKLQKDLSDISPQQTNQKNLDGHAKDTQISINDLVAYLIGWGQLLLKWNQLHDNQAPISFPEEGYKWNELGKLAQKFYNDYSELSLPERLSLLDNTVNTILALIEQKSNTELYEQGWYNQYTLGRMIQLNTASPYKNASIRIRQWKAQNAPNL